jgi:hypothetical protein
MFLYGDIRAASVESSIEIHFCCIYILTKSQHPSVPEIRSGARVGTVVPISEDEDEFGVAIG